MTTKSRHGTHSRRHGAGNRLSNRLAEQQRLERELRDALVSLDIPTVGNRREGLPKLRLMTVVLFSVRTGRVKRWEYAAPATMWQAEVNTWPASRHTNRAWLFMPTWTLFRSTEHDHSYTGTPGGAGAGPAAAESSSRAGEQKGPE